MKNASIIIIFALAVAPALAQEPPQSIHEGVFINDIWEHKVHIAGPHDFDETQANVDNLWEWANFACQFYGRRAIGPLSHSSPDSVCLTGLAFYPNNTNLYCSVHYLFACASH